MTQSHSDTEHSLPLCDCGGRPDFAPTRHYPKCAAYTEPDRQDDLQEPAHVGHCYGCTNEKQELCDEVTRLHASNKRLRDAIQMYLYWAFDDKDANRLPPGVSEARINILKRTLNDKAVEK